MARVEATYDEGTVVYDDEHPGDLVSGDAALIAALGRQTGQARPIPEMPMLLLAAYDASPWHFIAAVDNLRAPERPRLKSVGVEASPTYAGFDPST